METDDTGVWPALRDDESADAPSARLARIGTDVGLLSHVLSGYPGRHPAVWRSAEWAKDLKDLELACAHLRDYARELQELAGRIRGDGCARTGADRPAQVPDDRPATGHASAASTPGARPPDRFAPMRR